MVSMNCQECGESFEAKRSDARFCLPCREARKTATSKAWFEANPEKWHDYNKVCNEKHKEERAAYDKRWKAENPDKVAAKMARNYQRYREKRLQQFSQWRQENPEAAKANSVLSRHTRRARLAQVEGTWTYDEFKALCEAYDNRCTYCQKHDDNLTADHMIPIARGGENTIENIIPACYSCNSSKSDKTALEFLYPKAMVFFPRKKRKRKIEQAS